MNELHALQVKKTLFGPSRRPVAEKPRHCAPDGRSGEGRACAFRVISARQATLVA